MDIKKILLVALIAVAIVASVSAVSAGLFDGLFGEEQKDNVNELDNIRFNTTNETDFEKFDNQSSKGHNYYFSDKNKITAIIKDYNKIEDAQQSKANTLKIKNDPTQIVNGVVIYAESVKTGKYIGEPRYGAIIENNDLNEDVIVWSPDPNETAKMALSLKFK